MFKSFQFLIGTIASFALFFIFSPQVLAESIEEPTSGSMVVEEDQVSVFGTSNTRVGGGVWEYGTRLHGFGYRQKTTFSNYWHPSRLHGSAAQVGARTPHRSCVRADRTSHATQTGSRDQTAYVYWNTSCSL